MERLTSKRDWIEAGKDLSNEWGYSHIWRRLKQIEDILGDAYNLDRLRELVEADKAGQCVVLPVKIGDRVYTVFPLSFKREAKVEEIEINEHGTFLRGKYPSIFDGDAFIPANVARNM